MSFQTVMIVTDEGRLLPIKATMGELSKACEVKSSVRNTVQRTLRTSSTKTLHVRLLDATLYANRLASPGTDPEGGKIMVSSQQFICGARRSIRNAALIALVSFPSLALAQSGNGYLFRNPRISLGVRAGYELANTTGQPFSIMKRETTIGARSFDAFHLGGDLNIHLSSRFDFVGTVDLSSRTTTAEYREWEENGAPITHESTLDRVALGGGLRYNLVDRGRQISALAWIPTKTVPYVGGTFGILWYDLVQKGDFVEEVDESTGNIYTDELRSYDAGAMGQVFAGVERRINARVSLLGETRYTKASAQLNRDYIELRRDINLSGLAFTLGAAFRF
jgi:hypothetical protein